MSEEGLRVYASVAISQTVEAGWRFGKWPWFTRLFFSPKTRSMVTPFKVIYLRDDVWEHPDGPMALQFLPLFLHETTHALRAEKSGLLKWYFRYLTSAKFRLSEEIMGEANEAIGRALMDGRRTVVLRDVQHGLKPGGIYKISSKIKPNEVNDLIVKHANKILSKAPHPAK